MTKTSKPKSDKTPNDKEPEVNAKGPASTMYEGSPSEEQRQKVAGNIGKGKVNLSEDYLPLSGTDFCSACQCDCGVCQCHCECFQLCSSGHCDCICECSQPICISHIEASAPPGSAIDRLKNIENQLATIESQLATLGIRLVRIGFLLQTRFGAMETIMERLASRFDKKE